MNPDLLILGAMDPQTILAYEDQILRDASFTNPLLVLSQIEGYILGMDDLKLPLYEKAYQSIQDQNVILRTVGGKAVYSDSGVLNLSYILRGPKDFHQVYQTIAQELITLLSFLNLNIEIGEIKGSYCPGRYDLSIHQKKIGGIAQKRVKDRYCVSAYISVCGDQDERSHKVKQFYEQMQLNVIEPSAMSTLQAFCDFPLSIEAIIQQVKARSHQILDPLLPLSTTSVQNIKVYQEKLNKKTLDLESSPSDRLNAGGIS